MKNQKMFVSAAAILALSLLFRRMKSRFSFSGQTVIITGGSRGLGFALAQRIAQDRVNLAIIARDAQELDSAQLKLSGYGSAVSTWVCDVRDESELRATILAVAQRFGGIDLLINNAGEIVVGPFEAMSQPRSFIIGRRRGKNTGEWISCSLRGLLVKGKNFPAAAIATCWANSIAIYSPESFKCGRSTFQSAPCFTGSSTATVS